MAQSSLQRFLDAGVQFGEMSRKQAESAVRQLVKAGEANRRDTEKLVADLVERGKETSERLSETIQREVSKQVSWMSERFDTLEDRFEDLAENLADRVGVLMNGRMVAEGTPSQLIDGISGTVVSFALPESVAIGDAVSTFSGVLGQEVRVSGRLVEATVDASTQVVHRLTGWAIEHDIELEGLTVRRASLEDVFLQLTEQEEAQ